MNYYQQGQENQNAYTEGFTTLYPQDQDYQPVDLDMTDADLDKMLISSLEEDRAHWNKAPWKLQETDVTNMAFLLGDQINEADFLVNEVKYKDNRLFESVRAILSYATGQLAKPDIVPSKGDEVNLKGARDIGAALYQHSSDEKAEFKVRSAVMNLIARKRGYLKLRLDPNLGLNGDIVTEIVNPEDIIVSRFARYLQNPDKIYHRIQCSVQELCARFPKKEAEIKAAFNIQRGVYTQMSRMVYYFECWFTYLNKDNKPCEGVCWFVPESKLILDKMRNPNWVYTGSDKKQKEQNITSIPPKPFIIFNYFNTGHSFIDETCLVEQALPMQQALNKRLRQIGDNADYVNGRWIADKNAFSQGDARNLINKGAKTVALVDMTKVAQPLINVAPQQLGQWVENTVFDSRNEIDGIMGTPAQFKGADPDRQDTLGRDLMIKQQAGALQDDLVRAVSMAMEEYYKLKLQMMRVYYTYDYWFQVKGGDGKYEFILLNGENLDTNVKVSVQIDSTLPLDKASVRATAMQLWTQGNAIDIRTLYEDLGLPNPDIRAERYLKSQLDPVNYLKSIEISQINAEAEADIQLLLANKTPEEHDNYSQDYFDYFNRLFTTNRWQKIQGKDPKVAQRIIMFLAAIQHTVIQGMNNANVLDEAGIVAPPPQPPMPPQNGQNGMIPPASQPPIPQQPLSPPVSPAPPIQDAPPVPTQ